MTSEQNILSDLKPMSAGNVTFGDSAAGKIIGKRKLNFQGLSSLNDVMLIEGLPPILSI